MSVSIAAANGAGTTAPEEILAPYTTDWAARSVLHDLIGGGIAVTYTPPRPRAGELVLLYADEAAAWAGAQLHEQPTSFLLTETQRPQLDMAYTVTSRSNLALDEQTETWRLTIGFQEL